MVVAILYSLFDMVYLCARGGVTNMVGVIGFLDGIIL